jgi:hypothetical protein
MATVNEGQLDIEGVAGLFLINLQGEANLFGGQVNTFDLGYDGLNGPPPQSAAPAILNQMGGELGEHFFRVHDGGIANISGGQFGPLLWEYSTSVVRDGGVVNLFVKSFEVDGMPLSGLLNGTAVELFDRDVQVSGLLANGDPFDFQLTSAVDNGVLAVEPGGKLLVTLAIPEPTAVSLVGILTVGAILGRRRRA